ncbi:MAG: 3-phosphoshikimate 1-carboxyvinyltransferase [Candidatus Diapherotrites archaeon CG11_big_fil_rev_8_21_14_0_20_37_9]|nr:MAG: 3-phosphoshikimate 1-carboxyvinyltransferase [Candidatus Diapherotrites archaeon CG11_big_fil_rev_8_21_14_0_20_37_9]
MDFVEIKKIGSLSADIVAPPSKAHTLRALFISALAEGKSTLRNALNAEDQQIAAKALNDLGAKIVFNGKDYLVQGAEGQLSSPKEIIYTANSGVTTRFLIPIAGIAKGNTIIDGSERMRERPIKELLESASKIGLKTESKEGKLPVKVIGKTLIGGKTEIDASESSQFLSALLIAGPLTENGMSVSVKGEMRSKPYVDITLDCMADFGVKTDREGYESFFVKSGQSYKGRDYLIEGDYSSSSYLFAAAAITGGIVKVRNLNKNSAQGDKEFIYFLEKMGCNVNFSGDSIVVEGNSLNAIDVDMSSCPDVVPTLAVVAAFAEGKTRISNISHLSAKESNRIETTAENLRRCGIKAIPGKDFLEIIGGKPHGAVIEPYNDHRIAMAFSIMGLQTGEMRINNPNCVGKSFPDFFSVLKKFYGD